MKNKTFKKIRNYSLVIFVHAVRIIMTFVPWRAAAKGGEYLGILFYFLLKREREKIFRNLEHVWPGRYDDRGKRKFALENFRNYGRGMAEFMKFWTWPPEKTASLVKEAEGLEYFDRAFAEKRGIIAVTAHLANWEIMPVFMRLRGYRTGAIAKKIFDEKLDAAVNATRRRAGVLFFDRDTVSREMIRELKNGMLLGILADQDTRVQSIYAPFLGREAKTPSGPATLALKFGLYLCPVQLIRRPDGYYKIIVNKPYEIGPEATEERLVRMYNEDISRWIEENPTQWAWVHERWKSRET